MTARGGHRDRPEVAEGRGHRGGGGLRRRLVDVDHRGGLAREVGVEPGAHRGRHRGEGGDRAGGGEADHDVGAAEPLDRRLDLVGQGRGVHYPVRWASSAR